MIVATNSYYVRNEKKLVENGAVNTINNIINNDNNNNPECISNGTAVSTSGNNGSASFLKHKRTHADAANNISNLNTNNHK